jgi:multidrug efflux pump subunit AcrA (membrane-fusion protein)
VAEGNLQSAREQQAVDKLECQKIATMIERRKMRSPIEGVVTRVYKEEHELVAANATSVLTVAQLNPLRLTLSVPTANGLTLKAGDKVPLAFPETGEKASGTVELVAPITEAESGTVRLKLLIDNPHGAYRCGVRCAWDRPDDEDGPPEPATPDVESPSAAAPNGPAPNAPAPNAAAKND